MNTVIKYSFMEMGFWLCLVRKKKTCFIWTTRVKGLTMFIDLLFETDAMQAALYINSSVHCMSFPCKLILKFRMEGDISLSKKVVQKLIASGQTSQLLLSTHLVPVNSKIHSIKNASGIKRISILQLFQGGSLSPKVHL